MKKISEKTYIIDANKKSKQYWKDLWEYRELFFILAWRDISVRYKQTIIGVLWAILRPLLTMIVFSIIFGRLAKLPSEGIPYPIYVFSAMLPWYLFAGSFSSASESLINNSNLVSKVYFPRLIIPASTIIVNAIDFFISFIILIGLMFWYQFLPSWQVLTLPFFILICLVISFGIGVFIAALNVEYRDFRYIVPFIVQLGLYLSPVGFSSSIVPEKWQWLYALNPLVGVIDGFRWAISGGQTTLELMHIITSILIAIAVCYIGIKYFRKSESKFADVI